MASKVPCPECGEEIDKRGLTGHMKTHEDSENVEIVENDSEAELARDSESLRDMEIPENAVAIVERRDRAVVVTDEDRKDRIIDGILENENGNGNGGVRRGI